MSPAAREGVRIGVDVGSVRVGVAASDPSGLIATPVRTVARARDDAGGSAPDLEEIVALVRELGAMEVVVGLPRSLSGAQGKAAVTARTYAGRLAVRVAPVPVRLVDERLTTVEAHRSLRESGMDGRRQRSVVDQAAAVVILQVALDAERGSGRPPGELVRTDGRKPRTKDRHR
ncbi:Holliday junction resolvase RuvX [Pedococcus sp. 5OH_020]|uniref:Holliday junction resolvase RuvX n=1 Tax=Pedococcus sp. 5OH_020 TaxID=2989814 RepID=UPI0022E9F9A1|nr:Holliday junction resolvase RuvX [Pedococcus sp. 5OH_020]